MPQEVTSQANQYGLPEKTAQELPTQEKLAEQLRPATGWSGPSKPDIE